MRKLILLAFFSFLLINTSICQDLRKIKSYSNNLTVASVYYYSDSLIFGNVYKDGYYSYYYLKDGQWEPTNFKEGILSVSPHKKIYLLSKNAFSRINPLTLTVDKSYPIKLTNLPNYFQVFNDSFFIANDEKNKEVYKYDFNQSKIIGKTLIFDNQTYFYGVKLVEDSLLYLSVGGSPYKFNFRTNILTKLLIYSQMKTLDCANNRIVILNAIKQLFISKNYGHSFNNYDTKSYGEIMVNSLKINRYGINFITTNYKLITLDFDGNKLNMVDLEPILTGLVAYYKSVTCDHDIAQREATWLNDTCMVLSSYNGDVYKFYPWQNNIINYLGGPFNLGVGKTGFNQTGNLCFVETANGLWSFSSDTGKTWLVPDQIMKKNASYVKFVNSNLFILNSNKLNLFNFDIGTLDTAYLESNLKINDFSIIDERTLILFANKGIYHLDIFSKTLKLISKPSPFKYHTYLKKNKRIIALTEVEIFYSDNLGESWLKSNLTGFGTLSSLEIHNTLEAIEKPNGVISLFIQFNGSLAQLKSNDGGKNFYAIIDTIFSKTTDACELGEQVYLLGKDNLIRRFDANKSLYINDYYTAECKPMGIQSVDSGFFIWNSRAEIFYKKIPYQKNYTYSHKIKAFPNPTQGQTSIHFLVPKDYVNRIESIELYDLMGKKLENLAFNYSHTQNIYEVNNLPNLNPQFYLLVIKIKDGVTHREKVFIN